MAQGSASQTLGFSFVIDANGTYIVDDNGDQVIVNDPGNIDQIATGGVLAGGFATQTIAAVTQSAAGSHPGTGAASQSIGEITISATGSFGGAAGSADQTIADFSLDTFGGHAPIIAPEDLTTPAITVVGGLTWGGRLTCSSGGWGAAKPLSYRYQWRRAGANIAGQTTNEHIIAHEDTGKTLACLVTAVTRFTTLDQLSNEVRITGAQPATEHPSRSRSRYRKVVAQRAGGTAIYNWTDE